MEQPVRILIADDSAFMRLALADCVVSLPEVATTSIELFK